MTEHHAETAITWNQTGPQGPAGLAGPQGPAGPQGAGLSGFQLVTATQTLGTAYGSPTQFDGFARCPAGKKLIGGGASPSSQEAYISTSAPYRQGGITYDIWDAQALVRSDAAQGDAVTLTSFAYCVNAF